MITLLSPFRTNPLVVPLWIMIVLIGIARSMTAFSTSVPNQSFKLSLPSVTRTSTGTIVRLSAEGSSSQRQPWDVIRFVQQSSRFVLANPFGSNTRTGRRRTVQPGDILWKGARNNNEFTFGPLDDVVMGGASSSNFDDATGKWKGQVTDANNGGFIGIRSTPLVDWDCSMCQGIEIRLTVSAISAAAPAASAGKKKQPVRLKIVVRDSTEFNGIGWTTSADFGGGSSSTSTVKIPFAKQVPTRFAKTVSDQSFSQDQVKGLQFVFSKFEYDGALNPNFFLGNFEVQLEEIWAY